MKDLNLGDWLRYFLAGAIVVILFIYISQHSNCNDTIRKLNNDLSNLKNGFAGAGISLIVGATIYSLHRSLIYPIIFWIVQFGFSIKFENKKFHCDLNLPFFISEKEFMSTKIRWENSFLSQQPSNFEKYFTKISEWAGQVHFLYCTAWSILIINIFINSLDLKDYNWICRSFWLFLIAAIIHHLRYFYHEKNLIGEFKVESSKTKN